MTGRLDEISLAIGEMRAKLSSMADQQAASRAEASIAEARAEEHRARVRSELRSVTDGIAKIPPLTDRVTKMEPTVEDMKLFRVKLAVAATTVSIIVTGAFNVIYLAFAHIADFRKLLGGIFN